jgi:hypothetical protein
MVPFVPLTFLSPLQRNAQCPILSAFFCGKGGNPKTLTLVLPGAPEPGSPRTGLSPWGGEPALSFSKGLDFETWDTTIPHLPVLLSQAFR